MEFNEMLKPSNADEADRAAALAELTGTSESPAPQDKVEPVEAPAELKTEEPAKVDEAEAIRKKAESDAKAKYLSQVSIKAKALEAERARAEQLERELAEIRSKYDEGEETAETYIDKIVDTKLHKTDLSKRESEIRELDGYEKQEFLKGNLNAVWYLSELEKIKTDNPNLSWSAANNLYLAYNNPAELVKNPTNYDLWGWTPKAVFNPEPTMEDLRRQAEEEIRQFGRY